MLYTKEPRDHNYFELRTSYPKKTIPKSFMKKKSINFQNERNGDDFQFDLQEKTVFRILSQRKTYAGFAGAQYMKIIIINH